ncbi:MAG: hypothetical protein GY858_04365 [Candidatus Omnitrophica bacterium]|nr:hypothetical protein [Candidatus Omnitrophota bacterium]
MAPSGGKQWEQFFQYQEGAGFHGDPYQRGFGLASIFSGIFRKVLPIAKTAGKSLPKQALNTGLNVASDVIEGRDIGESLEEHGRQSAANLIRRSHAALGTKTRKPKKKVYKGRRQTGKGLGVFRQNTKHKTVKLVKGKSKKDIFG